MNTNRLYWEDCYLKEFKAKVVEINEDGIVLDRTCFYPQGGGQPGDSGYLNNVKINDTKTYGDRLIHITETPQLFSVGDTVHGIIDWDRRYSIMRIHSASHIMEYFLFQKLGKMVLVGSFISETKDKSTYKSNLTIDSNIIKDIENEANSFVGKNLPINLYKSNEDLYTRYWECDSIKYPCGGTHPKNTNEIGELHLKRKSGGKGQHLIITTLTA